MRICLTEAVDGGCVQTASGSNATKVMWESMVGKKKDDRKTIKAVEVRGRDWNRRQQMILRRCLQEHGQARR